MKILRTSTVAVEAAKHDASGLAQAISDAVNAACEAIEADGGIVIAPISYWSMPVQSIGYGRTSRGLDTTEHENVVFASISFEARRQE